VTMTSDPGPAERSGPTSEVSPARRRVNNMISAGLLDDLMGRGDAAAGQGVVTARSRRSRRRVGPGGHGECSSSPTKWACR
jgi:hypothetical protein